MAVGRPRRRRLEIHLAVREPRNIRIRSLLPLRGSGDDGTREGEREDQHKLFHTRAAFTRAGVKGYSRRRTPVASKNAFAIAADAAAMISSPAPVDFWSIRCTPIVVTAGDSANRRIGYEFQSRLVTLVFENVTDRKSVVEGKRV